MRGVPVVRGSIVDVPLSQRDLAGLESQGLARTLGTLGGCTIAGSTISGSTIGDDTIEMEEECVRPGEVLLAPGKCGPVPQPVTPYATPPKLTSTNVKLTTTTAASAHGVAAGMSKTTMLLAAIGGIGLVYYLSKKR